VKDGKPTASGLSLRVRLTDLQSISDLMQLGESLADIHD
jgi:hypothetical protein